MQPQPQQEWTTTKTGGARHGLHLALTLLTCGLWAPIWFLAWVFQKKHTVTVPKR